MTDHAHSGGKSGGEVEQADDEEPGEVPKKHQAASLQKNFGLRGDQKETDPKVTALVQSHRNGTPLVLLTSDEYALLPFTFQGAFAVLGW